MRSRVLYALVVVLFAAAGGAGTGCSSDPMSGGSQDLGVTVTPNPSGSGRFNNASFIISAIQALPADPAEAALFGSERLLFRFTPYTANLTLTQPSAYSSIALSAGSYVVTRIEFSPLALVDTEIPPNTGDCIDRVQVINGSQPPGIPSVFRFDNPPSLSFTIQPGQTNLALTVDVPGLIEDYEAAYTCTFVPCTGCPVDPRPTLTAFDQTAYRNALLANITLK